MKKRLMLGTIIFGLIFIIPRFLCCNLTASVPEGLYLIDFSPLGKGKYVRFKMAREICHKYEWIHASYFLKRVAAVEGDFVIISEKGFFVNGCFLGTCLTTDKAGNILPDYQFNGIVPAGYIFVAGDGDSFDSRYFGPVPINKIDQFRRIF